MKVKILSKETLLEGFFKIEHAKVQHEKFTGGWTPALSRYNLDRGEAVAVLIYLTDKQKFILVRQFRYAVYQSTDEGWIDEIVAGVLDEDSPLECAKRECIEEAGYEIDKFDHLGTVFSTPGITTERIHLYIGYCQSSDKKHEGGGLDEEHEDIQILELDIDEAYYRLMRGKFGDAKTMLTIQHFFLKHPEMIPR